MGMRKVSRDEFYRGIYEGKLDVHPEIQNTRWPFTTLWRFPREPGRPAYGKSIGHDDGSSDYFLPAGDGA